MKKVLTFLLSLVMIVCITACAEYRPPVNSGENPPAVGPSDPANPNPSVPEASTFTVKLEMDGVPFSLPYNTKATAQWTDGIAVYTAPFERNGTASITGLDGDYRVTVNGLPEGYTYDPNIYEATNFYRDVVIRVYRLASYTGTGTDKYDHIIKFRSTGVYRAVFRYTGQTVYFEYEPTQNGVYTLKTMLDITADEINPVLDVYKGSKAYKPEFPTETIDGGGVSGAYTKNVVWEVSLYGDEVGNVFAFGLRAESFVDATFPVYIDFVLERNGEFTRDPEVYELVTPTENFKQAPEVAGTWRNVGYYYQNRLDSRMFAVGEDGYYHVYNAQTGVYGATLYAKITVSVSFLSMDGGFLNPLVRLRFSGKNYNQFISAYASYVNGDGVYPVTEELREFLQGYAISQSLFSDGNGLAETVGGYIAAEDDMWLFAVGYYS